MTSHVRYWRDRVGLVDYDTQIKGKMIAFVGTYLTLLESILTVNNRCCSRWRPHKISCLPTITLTEWVILYLCLSLQPSALPEVRCQLVDQLKVLDAQLEQKSQQLQDLTDYLRRRGEIESEYSRSLEKLAERFTSRIKRLESTTDLSHWRRTHDLTLCPAHMLRKEPGTHSVAQVWLTLLSHTRQESREHSGLSESCNNFLIQPLTQCLEYTQRLAKKVLILLLIQIQLVRVCACRMFTPAMLSLWFIWNIQWFTVSPSCFVVAFSSPE